MTNSATSYSPVRDQGRPFLQHAAAWVVLCWCWLTLSTTAFAAEVVILKSSDIAAYDQAIAGFKSSLGGSVTLSEYDLEGDLEKGRKLARKIRASDPALVLAIGLKAAKAAQLEIVDIPVVYAMVLDPAKYGLTTRNMTGVLLEVPLERQLALIRSVLPNVKRIGTLYDPSKTAGTIDEVRRLVKPNGTDLLSGWTNRPWSQFDFQQSTQFILGTPVVNKARAGSGSPTALPTSPRPCEPSTPIPPSRSVTRWVDRSPSCCGATTATSSAASSSARRAPTSCPATASDTR